MISSPTVAIAGQGVCWRSPSPPNNFARSILSEMVVRLEITPSRRGTIRYAPGCQTAWPGTPVVRCPHRAQISKAIVAPGTNCRFDIGVRTFVL